tara:strand:+ start:49 stop:1185 length:1137 start_codon:yes stop_codon:yes gene_type:complete
MITLRTTQVLILLFISSNLFVNSLLAQDVKKGVWELADTIPNTGIQEHKAALLPKDKVLLAGGTVYDANSQKNVVTSKAYIFDLENRKWKPTQSMKHPRSEHKLITLKNGNVLAIGGGGETEGKSIHSSCEIYNHKSNKWRQTGSLNIGRAYAYVTLMKDGRVLLSGGGKGNRGGYRNGCEIFNPTTEKWTLLPNSDAINGPVVTLNDGRVMAVMSNFTSIYNPSTEIWETVDGLKKSRFNYKLIALNNGTILAIGGATREGASKTCELFTPALGKWQLTGDINTARTYAFVTVLKDGRVLIAGGRTKWTDQGPLSTTSTELYDPKDERWTSLSPLNNPTQEAPGVQFSSGEILIFGGWSGFKGLNTTEIFTVSNKKN